MNSILQIDKRTKAKKWILRFIKFNLIGFSVFLIGSLIYYILFDQLGSLTWLVANGVGGILQFSLISYLNRKKKGKMFDACPENQEIKVTSP